MPSEKSSQNCASSRRGRCNCSPGCAQRLLPLVEACASQQTTQRYQEGLEAAWSAGEGEQRTALVRALDEAPEMSTESSDEIEYWAVRSIAVLTDSLREDLMEEPEKLGRKACSTALELHETIDDTLAHPEGSATTRIIDPRDTVSPGPWESQEIEAQQRALSLLRAAQTRNAAVADLRLLSLDRADALRTVIPAFLRAGAWIS